MILVRRRSVIPGFGLTLGYTLMYLSLIVLIPLATLFFKSATMSWEKFWGTITSPSVMESYRLTFGASFIAASVNAVFGFVVAWTLVRYEFLGKRFIDALIDLPFALPTAVSGIALAAIYSPSDGWIGQHLAAVGIQSAFSPLGITIALTFIGLPFVVRTLQPALHELEADVEEASASLGANRWQTFRRVIFPVIFPALLTGFALAFARAIGEYGSVVFISGNKRGMQIASQMIIKKLEINEYEEATAIAMVMLVASFGILLLINVLQWWSKRRG